MQRASHYPAGWRCLANAFGQLGRIDDAHEALEKFVALNPRYRTEEVARGFATMWCSSITSRVCAKRAGKDDPRPMPAAAVGMRGQPSCHLLNARRVVSGARRSLAV